MTHKSEVLVIFVEWRRRIKLQTDRKIKILKSENGEKYKSDLFLQLYRDEGIEKHFKVRETPQQNGIAERIQLYFAGEDTVLVVVSNSGLNKTF